MCFAEFVKKDPGNPCFRGKKQGKTGHFSTGLPKFKKRHEKCVFFHPKKCLKVPILCGFCGIIQEV
jgi:hypothetical protein